MKNRYSYRSRISEAKFRQIVRLFALDLDATQISDLSGLNRNTINRYLHGIRLRIVDYCEAQSPFSGEIDVDDACCGSKRIEGKRGRDTFGKTAVFGIFKRNGHVYTKIVPDCRKVNLQPIIRGRGELGSVVNSHAWPGYDGVVDVGSGKLLRIDHGKDEYVRGKAPINRIEGFWGFAKSRRIKFRGMSKQTFHLHLKECEFRYNQRRDDIYKTILNVCRTRPLN